MHFCLRLTIRSILTRQTALQTTATYCTTLFKPTFYLLQILFLSAVPHTRTMEAAKETVGSILEQVKAALQTHGERLPKSLQEGNLIPGPADGLIPASFKPTTQLHVSYNGKDVELGNLFRVYECKVAPNLSFQREADVDSNTAYTLMLVDPDAPTPDDPKYSFWRHWVLTGLEPLSGEGKVVAATKQPATSYHPPGPTKE